MGHTYLFVILVELECRHALDVTMCSNILEKIKGEIQISPAHDTTSTERWEVCFERWTSCWQANVWGQDATWMCCTRQGSPILELLCHNRDYACYFLLAPCGTRIEQAAEALEQWSPKWGPVHTGKSLQRHGWHLTFHHTSASPGNQTVRQKTLLPRVSSSTDRVAGEGVVEW